MRKSEGMGKQTTCATKPVTIRQWLTCGMCWEVKAGVSLLVASKLLMWWGNPPVESVRWRVGSVVFWAAVGCLVFGLIRDVWLIATTKYKSPHAPQQTSLRGIPRIPGTQDVIR